MARTTATTLRLAIYILFLLASFILPAANACGNHGPHIPYHNQAVSHGYCSESLVDATARCKKTFGENTKGYKHCVASADRVYRKCVATADDVQLRLQLRK
ncbi:hypothetical protein BDZ88DRAFT_438508 [Geranomyces variabilis]|nr:hypothetical protein BDZ88DRAFT_438508 [Geranomyces variabilis]KAJ3137456.1 hypothetical protein HDU90_001857 [Geranomyces variabilis]